ncbi:MAG: ribosome maturation factor RimP [Syntrophobacterales bacterium]|nr:ribosome maturation factor RimP [Syntrophobacterales bacterium]
MTDTLRDQLWDLLRPVVESQGMELIFIECLRMPSRWVVRIFLDKEEGITVDDCSLISPLAGDIMDVHEIPPGPYTLEVSSPGLDRPLFRDQDFLKFKGAAIKVKTNRKIEGIKNFKGEIIDYVQEEDGPYLVIRSGVNIYRIQRDAFDKANLDYKI